ncbi:MFS transporter [Demequina muriae]|uniref:MFS transporter n=1 Tax=Demequina muriae TaxID=3051664 RepID=A0ABT8GGT2_9MICO|nr:MFS transporter [Demequina sp. EGI L300058]MDN4480638.1 MFS transporter [Demequina sp. EGI L300058]
MSRTFASLKYVNYRLWFAGALVSNVGTWMQRVAQDWLVLTVLTNDSGVAVGVVTALQFLPFLILGPWAGVLADRMNQRALLIATQGAAAMLGLGLGALVLLGQAELWHVYAFAFGLGIVSALDVPVRQTFVASLVPPDGLTNAVGLNSASFNAARLIGPGVAGLTVAWIGIGWVFVVNGLTFIATIVALLLMRSSELVPLERAPRSPGQIREGIRYVRGRSDVVVVMIVVSVVAALGLNFQMTSALMARIEFDRGPEDYGLMGSVVAIGSLAGALLAARRSQVRLRLIFGSAFMFGVASALMALMPSYELYLVASVAVGFFALTMLTSANAAIQTSTSTHMRGRVMALYSMILLGSTPFGSPLVGWIGDANPRWAIGVGAIAAITVALAATVWSVRHWNLEVTYHRHRPLLEFTYPTQTNPREDAVLRLRAQQIEDASGQP